MTITSVTAPARRLPVLGAVAGPVLFCLTWLILGFVSDGYTLFDHTFTDYAIVSQPVSGLGMGDTAPYMNAAFVLGGVLTIVGVVAVVAVAGRGLSPASRRTVVALLSCTGAGQVVCGVFDLEHVLPHMLGFLLAMGVPVIGFAVAGHVFRRVEGWRTFGTWLMRLGSPLTAVLLVAFFATFTPTADGAEHGVAGLVQRAGIVEVLAWYVAMGLLAWRAANR